jgi:beta-aspartyl-peptidase (threonine type)
VVHAFAAFARLMSKRPVPRSLKRMPRLIIAHGGAASNHMDADGPQAAADLGLAALREGRSPLDAVVLAAAHLEDDPRFNAGTGSNLRLDGKTIEMDASCMTSDGKFGAVACIRDVRNPVRVARLVYDTPHNLLAGDGAIAYARMHGYPPYDPLVPEARRRYDEVRRVLRLATAQSAAYDWDMAKLANHWNYPQDLASVMGDPGAGPGTRSAAGMQAGAGAGLGAGAGAGNGGGPTTAAPIPGDSDTVGAVATDGVTFAAASSTGGTISTLLGRVGDVPLLGCGIFAGEGAAVAVTGSGDFLARKMLSLRVYQDLRAGTDGPTAIANAVALFAPEVDVGVIYVKGADGGAAASGGGGGNRDMAWAIAQEES